MRDLNQLLLNFEHKQNFKDEDFYVSSSNYYAFKQINSWPKWEKNFLNEISIVVGDEWFAGNLSYHLSSRPKWLNKLDKNLKNLGTGDGVIYTGNPKVLKEICPGIFGTIKPIGICMIGSK